MLKIPTSTPLRTTLMESLRSPRECLNVLMKRFTICDALRDLVPLAKFKKREKHPWRSVTFSKLSVTFS